LKNPKKPMGIPLARPIPPKEKEIYELNSDGDFSSIRTTKTRLNVYFHFFILAM
jgi:hypothetical protein